MRSVAFGPVRAVIIGSKRVLPLLFIGAAIGALSSWHWGVSLGLLAIGITVLAFVYPAVALFIVPFGFVFYEPLFTVGLTVTTQELLAIPIAWHAFRKWSGRDSVRTTNGWRLFLILGLLYGTSMAASFLTSTNIGMSATFARRFLLSAGVAILLAYVADRPKLVLSLIAGMIGAGLAGGVYGLYAYLGGQGSQGDEWNGIARLKGLSGGNGGFVAQALVMSVTWLVAGGQHRLGRLLAAFPVPFLGIALLVSITRSWIVAAGVGLLVVVGVTVRRRKWFLGVLPAFVTVGLAVYLFVNLSSYLYDSDSWRLVVQRLFSFDSYTLSDPALYERFLKLKVAGRLFGESPLIGIGIGTLRFLGIVPAVGNEDLTLAFFDNQYIEVAVETGVLGLVFFLLLILGALWKGLSKLRNASSPIEAALITALVSALCSWLVGLLGWSLYGGKAAIANFLALVGLLFAIDLKKPKGAP